MIHEMDRAVSGEEISLFGRVCARLKQNSW